MRSPAVVLVASLACGCTTHQLHVAKRAGEITAGAALLGMLATIGFAAADPGVDTDILEYGALFVPLTVGGALVYVAADTAEPPPELVRVDHTSTWQAAMDLAKQAKHAARSGDCAEVQAIGPRVRDLDDTVYQRFVRDKVIQTCLPAAPPP
jgi:LmbE family N-acetylglucosaminyl deacetylase